MALTQIEVTFAAAELNIRKLVRSGDISRKMLALQNQHDTAVFRVSNKLAGASRIVNPGESLLWDIYPSSDPIYAQCDTAGAVLLIEEGY